MPQYFTLTEAEKLLSKVEPALREALALHAAYQQAEVELSGAVSRVAMLGGSIVDRAGMGQLRERRDAAMTAIGEALDKIQDWGCQVKDLDTGLVDFPTLYRGEEVLLCWRFGEQGIHFWHGLEEGFRGRKPIDQDFLDHHRGDRAE